jgi:hypothetical protein
MAPREVRRLPTASSGLSLPDRIRYHAIRWVPLFVTALVTYALFPPPAGVLSRVPDIGKRAEGTVVAPFPNCPKLFQPHANSTPLLFSARACS